MKFFVPTYMRVGSTWVCEALEVLTESKEGIAFVGDSEHCLGVKATERELALFKEAKSNVVKTHRFLPVDLMELLGEPDNYIVCCRRNFYDTLVSVVLYERKVRAANGDRVTPEIQSLMDQYPGIPDDAFINLLISVYPKWVERELKIWRQFDHVLTHERVITLSYDKLNGDAETLINKLNRYVRASASVVSQAIRRCTFETMQARHPPEFVRAGIIGGYKRYLDRESIEWIRLKLNEITTKKLSEL